MLRRILVANRGEIACRVVRACHAVGIEAAAVFSEADEGALHVRQADSALCIGPPAPAESYLNQSALLHAARALGCDAVHPGYGFLAENAGFAELVQEAGLVWVGPPPAAIRAMGLKVESRACARQAGAPVVPGYEPPVGMSDAEVDSLIALEAAEVGYPLLVKATAGGGGKGMRLVASADALPAALAAARREAQGAFGDSRVYLERYIERPRHIEIQLLADTHGNVVHFGERECSIQRRHQKVLEECPAPLVAQLRAEGLALRERLGAWAVAIARQVGYVSAGTVEFIADESGNAWFLEMNTRLQVEHPVTELVYGVDLAAWQIRIAAGEALPWRQAEIVPRGHAIEARFCAEDPAQGFLPQAGRLGVAEFPTGEGWRVDSGVFSGWTIPQEYDSLAAKLIAHGETREAALARLREGLRLTCLLGVTTNQAFLSAIASQPAMASAGLHTGFIDEHLAGWQPSAPPAEALIAAALALAPDLPASGNLESLNDSWQRLRGWTNSGLVQPEAAQGRASEKLTHREQHWTTELTLAPGRSAQLGLNNENFALSGISREGGVVRFTRAGIEQAWRYYIAEGKVHLSRDGETYSLELGAGHGEAAAQGGSLTCRMPGKVVALTVEPGARVRRGQLLLVLEAMKMEHEVLAPADGVLTGYLVEAGGRVMPGQLLADFAPDAKPA